MTRGMIPADLFRIQWVSDARIAPDGRTLAFTVTRLDEEARRLSLQHLDRTRRRLHPTQTLYEWRGQG